MPDDENTNSTDSTDNSDNSDNSNESNSSSTGSMLDSNITYLVGADKGGDAQAATDAVVNALTSAGHKAEALPIGPNKEQTRNEHDSNYCLIFCVNGGQAGATWSSFAKDYQSGMAKTIVAYQGWIGNPHTTSSAAQTEELIIEHDAGGFAQSWMDEMIEGHTIITFVQEYSDCFAGFCVSDESAEDLGQKIASGSCGVGTSVAGANSGGTAQVKDTTFERCVRRICAATDSIFIVEGNAAVLFPYTDWMAFTLRQKINTIEANDIDPDTFTMEYTNDGFYNKVTIAWGGATLPERFAENAQGVMEKVDRATNYTLSNIYDNMVATNFNYAAWQKAKEVAADAVDAIDNANQRISDSVNGNTGVVGEAIDNVIDKAKTTQIISQDDDGGLLLSEQYDSLVEIYGELEKRVESAAPDYETAQYIVNALLIQYVRDFNNSCKCRALTNRKYIGGTFYAVQNPWTKESELFYLNGYTIRTQDDEPMYHDLDFKYGPEGAEEITDYQALSGGGGATTQASSSSSEDQIWADAAKCKWAQDQPDCSTNDPETAKKHYDEYTEKGEEVHFDCYGMSAYLYYRFNNEANIPCRIVGDSSHKVVMLYKNNDWQETRDQYQNLDYNFRWRSNQNTALILDAPNSSGSTSGGNTDSSNTNSGNSESTGDA